MPTIRDLADLGQSVWLDYIKRSFIDSGELSALIAEGVAGVTANPTILEKAIAESSDYDRDIARLAREGKTDTEIYEALARDDIGRAADLLRPVWDRTHGGDGYVSLEVSPDLARDTSGTVEAAKHLFAMLSRPNVYIKVPATKEGYPAIRQLIAEGINVNITLMFSLSQYEAVAEAYLSGLETRLEAGQEISLVTSVASFFVSRVDTLVDKELARIGNAELQGKIAIANAKRVYGRFRELFQGPRWGKLAACGAHLQRPLWASTSTKNPAYPDTLYVDELIGPDTVNTIPPATLTAFKDHGRVRNALAEGMDEVNRQLGQLDELGVDLEEIGNRLTDEGIGLFAKSFDELMSGIAAKRG
ncbi:MAG: transaldolase [Armatimonadota bacterium]